MPTTGSCECARATSPHRVPGPRRRLPPRLPRAADDGLHRLRGRGGSRRCWHCATASSRRVPAPSARLRRIADPASTVRAAARGVARRRPRPLPHHGRALPAGRRRARRRAVPPRPRPGRRADRGIVGARARGRQPAHAARPGGRSSRGASRRRAVRRRRAGRGRPAVRCWRARCSALAMANKPWAIGRRRPRSCSWIGETGADGLWPAPWASPPCSSAPHAPAQRGRADEHRRATARTAERSSSPGALVVPRASTGHRVMGPLRRARRAIARRRRADHPRQPSARDRSARRRGPARCGRRRRILPRRRRRALLALAARSCAGCWTPRTRGLLRAAGLPSRWWPGRSTLAARPWWRCSPWR